MYNSNAVKGTYPTLAELETARKKAKNSSDLTTRFGRDLMFILGKLLKGRAKGIVNTRKTAVTAYDWQLVADTEGLDVSVDEKRLERSIKTLSGKLPDLLFGSFLFRIKREKSVEGSFVNYSLEHIELTDYEKVNENSFYLYDAEGEKTLIDISVNNTEWIYLTDDEADLGGLIDSIAEDVIDLKDLKPKWKRLNNRMQGLIVGTTDSSEIYMAAAKLGLSQDELKKYEADLGNALKGIGTDAAGALQTIKGIDVKLSTLVEAAAAGSYELYKKTLESDIAVAILGQANTTELPNSGGSRAALQVLNLVKQDILFADVSNLTNIVNQFVQLEYLLSYGKPCPYRFEVMLDDLEDTEANARALTYIVTSGLPIQVKKSELYRKIGYSEPEKTDTPDMLFDLSTNSTITQNTPAF